MKDFFNQLICVLLIVAITIVFIKTIYTNPYKFSINNEGFQNSKITSPTFYEKLYLDDGGKEKYEDLISRLLKDDDFVQRISELFKQDFYKSTHQVSNGEGGETILEKREQIAAILDRILTSRRELSKIPEKYDYIYNKFNEFNDDYKNKKKQLDTILVNSFKETDMTEFNKKNIRLKKKLKAFTDSLKETPPIPSPNSWNQGAIMKNIATNFEFILIKNRPTNPEKYIVSSVDPTSEENTLYVLSLDHGYESNYVLEINGKGALTTVNNRKTYQQNNMKQFFIIVKISNNNEYNKNIKLSGNHRQEHLLSEADNSIIYPFFIICPFSIPGYCIAHKNNNIYLQPVRNDVFQQFTKVSNSSFCQINQS